MTRSFLKSLTAFAFAVLVVFGTTVSVTAQTTFYSDRATFETANPGLDQEDFSGNLIGPNAVSACSPTLNSTTNDLCFAPGGVLPGFEMALVDDGGTSPDLVLATTGFLGSPCDAVGGNSFVNETDFHFSPAVRAAGFEVIVLLGDPTSTFTVEVFGPGGSLGTQGVVGNGLVEVFFGVDTVDPGGIDLIEVREDVDSTADLYCDLQFGDDPIPVELVSFDAVVNGTDVSLNWATASETNNAGFEVQVQDGEDWNVLGFVEGHGTTTEAQTYGYTAEGMAVGTHNFRLKQIDYDGAFEYSDELEVTVETPGTHLITSAYPNPFNPQSQFTLAVAQDQRVTVELYSTLGRRVAVLFSGTVEANQAQLLTIDGAGLASGMYIVRVTGERFADALSVTLLK